jgi:hypothetical protein
MYGMRPRGTSELRYLVHNEFKSVGEEYFSAEMQKLHDQIKEQLQDNIKKCKDRVDQHRRELQFDVGDKVLAHFQKERFPKGTYNKLKMKNIGPCRILRKFAENAYEIELPYNVGISPIFNIVDLYPYREDEVGVSYDQKNIKWGKPMPVAEKPQMEKILDQRIGKRTRMKTYFEYLVKWKGHLVEDSIWISEEEI